MQQECRPRHCNSNSRATARWAALCPTPRLLCLTTDPGILLYFCGQEGGVGGDSILLLLLLLGETAEGWQKQSSDNFDGVSHWQPGGCSCACPTNKHTCARRRCPASATPEDAAAAGECPSGLADVSAPLGTPGTLTVSLIERVFNFGNAEAWLLAVAILPVHMARAAAASTGNHANNGFSSVWNEFTARRGCQGPPEPDF